MYNNNMLTLNIWLIKISFMILFNILICQYLERKRIKTLDADNSDLDGVSDNDYNEYVNFHINLIIIIPICFLV